MYIIVCWTYQEGSMNKIITITIIAIFFAGLTGNVYCQDDSTKNVLKQGLLGAGTGAIAAGASGGKAGQGALIGAGTGIIGSALLDTITQPSQPKRVYRRAAPRQQQYQPAPQAQYQQAPQQYQSQNLQVQDVANPEGGKKRIIKKYDDKGKLVSEEEIYY